MKVLLLKMEAQRLDMDQVKLLQQLQHSRQQKHLQIQHQLRNHNQLQHQKLQHQQLQVLEMLLKFKLEQEE